MGLRLVALAREGMRLCFTYMGERMEGRPCASWPPNARARSCCECDVTNPETDRRGLRGDQATQFGFLDTVVHAVAFAQTRGAASGDFYHTTRRTGYMIAHEVSAYSLTAVARRALPLMEGREGSIITLSPTSVVSA